MVRTDRSKLPDPPPPAHTDPTKTTNPFKLLPGTGSFERSLKDLCSTREVLNEPPYFVAPLCLPIIIFCSPATLAKTDSKKKEEQNKKEKKTNHTLFVDDAKPWQPTKTDSKKKEEQENKKSRRSTPFRFWTIRRKLWGDRKCRTVRADVSVGAKEFRTVCSPLFDTHPCFRTAPPNQTAVSLPRLPSAASRS
jgi:hypothetical protein